MRILQIRLKNLNSLVGEWVIDLTHPAYAGDGLFAITGPTGAGKSTLLDAICLALFGRTPRLNKITKGANEIMSRRTGVCFAEVTFETPLGRYRCHWGQRRARNRPGGELQTPTHEIANADTGDILESKKLREVAERIEKITGMDFERFTRSMLLAQGGFAAFLQAAPDERSPLLEQITGTTIYSDISIRVHERYGEEHRKLEGLQESLQGLTPLSADEEKDLMLGLAEKQEQDGVFNQRMAQHIEAIHWIEGMAQLEDELKKVALDKETLRGRMAEFAPDQARLDAAGRALELDAEYAELAGLRHAQQVDATALAECREAVPARVGALGLAEERVRQATEKLNGTRQAQQAAAPQLRKVRELDVKIQEKAGPIKALDTAIAEQNAAVAILQGRQRQDETERDAKRSALQALQDLMERQASDASLVENLSALCERFDALAQMHTDLLGKQQEILQAEDTWKAAAVSWKAQSEALEKQRAAYAQMQDAQATQQGELQHWLEAQTLSDWRERQSVLHAQKTLLAQAGDAVRAWETSVEDAKRLSQRRKSLELEQAALARTQEQLADKQQGLENERGLLEENLTMLQQIVDMADARHHLQDGRPCPVCGALEHPFALGNVPTPDQTRLRLADVRSRLAALVDQGSENQVQQARIGKDLEQTQVDQNRGAQIATTARAEIEQTCAQLPASLALGLDDPELGKKLEQAYAEQVCQLDQVATRLKTAEAIDADLAARRNSMDAARENLAQTERDAQAQAYRQETASQQLERLRTEAARQREQQRQSLASLDDAVKIYGLVGLTLEGLDVARAQLTERRDHWLAHQREKADLERQWSELGVRLGHQAEQIQHGAQDLERQQQQRQALLLAQRSLSDERQGLFIGPVEAGEARLASAVAEAELALDDARRQHQDAAQSVTQHQAKVDELAHTVDIRKPALQAAEQAFGERLASSGFSGEDDYRAARLSGPDRQALAQRSQQLAREQAECTAREREKTVRLEAERQKQVTDAPLDTLRQAHAALVEERGALQQQIGAITQRLQDNRELRQRQQDQVAAVEAQKRECERWDLLHDLIGSADGKKYRNFAQGLTFEIVVGHANRQLRKMSDRYLLIRDREQPLELNVIDNDQAGEVRSTKNLSGGESFIVSLALALGLSQMVSQQVRVDSLFLDEGFGTLDEEALDTALDTLGGLQREGKLIGIISHVSALKERISTQIQVSPLTGGRSRIDGPGCTEVAGS